MYSIKSMPNQIDIGFTGEKQFRTIEIDMSAWMEDMPDGVPSIVHIRPGETKSDAYIAATTFEDDILRWTITSSDLGSSEGIGTAQIWLEEEENSSVVKRGKSILVATLVHGAIDDASETVPAAQTSWMEQMTALKVATVDAKVAAVAAQGAAETAQGKAEDAQTAAETAQDKAEDAQAAAETAQGKAEDAQEAAELAQTAAETAQGKAEDAQTAAEAAQTEAEAAILHYPYVDTTTGNWMVWDVDNEEYVDTNVHAQGATGTVPNLTVGNVTTLLPTQGATVTRRSGSPDTAPIFDFGIPKGDTGEAENVYGTTVPMSETDSTKVKTAIDAKADKVNSPTSGNFAGLDSNGNLTDSGHKHSDYLASTLKGVANGLAELDSSGKVPTSQLPAELPSVTSSDNGKALMVDNGSWAAGNLPIASRLTNGTVSVGNNINVDSNGVISVDLSGKLDTANVYNDLDQTASGYALDARQGASLNEAIATLSNKSPTASSNPEIPNNADLNSYTTPGAYTVVSDASASTISNMPRNASGKLIVMYRPNSNYLTQIYFTSSSLFLTYSRNYNNGTWTAWVQLAYFEQGTWTPHIYDYETYVRAMDVQPYFKIGGLYIMTASQYDVDFSGISTMLEIRNLPCTNLLCGEIFIQNIKASSIAQGIGRGIQPSGAYAYIRSNLKSDDLISTTLTGRTTLLLIGL